MRSLAKWAKLTCFTTDDAYSLEEIIIYDVVEYQSTITSTIQAEDDVVEIKTETTEKYPSENTLGNTSQILTDGSDNKELEPTTISQVVIAHEEEVLAQSFGEPSDEDLEQWTKILNDKADDEQWRKDGVHEEDIALITKDRSDPTPFNNDCISNIYGYEEVDDPAKPTAIFYRYCKPPSSLEEVHRRKNFRVGTNILRDPKSKLDIRGSLRHTCQTQKTTTGLRKRGLN